MEYLRPVKVEILEKSMATKMRFMLPHLMKSDYYFLSMPIFQYRLVEAPFDIFRRLKSGELQLSTQHAAWRDAFAHRVIQRSNHSCCVPLQQCTLFEKVQFFSGLILWVKSIQILGISCQFRQQFLQFLGFFSK